ncbi:TrbM/KikA/MpfK family conjugal transfer protein [Klebsiella pneumoniae]|uniref:TrbM/KikA/MpfK family conjugal transfer protein n=1 Tax=Klebsiella pneumoniae TaxID=573 RepID=UPI002948DD42|nr:TrbM/KikA/MpfK family conjugal transfer protein [Klebsiella pneumoniae]MDV5663177.1 TrbM/KikA/MpfK family conjugal transfer protein [Klebsiella pneumoniae]
MKKTVTTAVLLCAFAAGTAHAEEKADPNDPCAMVLCLAGKLDGSSPAECDPMYKKVLCQSGKRINMVLPDHTADARKKKLNECPAADAGTVSKIISSFGRLKNF